MASDNGNEGFLGRMVKRVSAPARDLIGLPSDAGASQFADVEKAELKAMIERKRRNDFVRKRELDMLRRIRREGLSPEQANSLGASSRLDDSDVKPTQLPGNGTQGVKDKIDAIEKQMVGGAVPGARLPRGIPAPPTLNTPVEAQSTLPVAVDETRPMVILPEASNPPPAATAPLRSTASSAPPKASPVAAPAPSPSLRQLGQPSELMSMEVSEIVHDHELDEAVIAFANADFALCERALTQLTAPGGARQAHSDTWLVRFDLYRATGQQAVFDTLASDYLHRFQRSAPQWFSLPKLVAETASHTPAGEGTGSEVAWLCPVHLDVDAVVQLNSQTLQLPQPWVLDWSRLLRIDPDAAARLYRLMQGWARQTLEMRWLASDRLFSVLQDAAPVGVRDADPA
ncbi:hypothetical protein, partial [Ideonella sp.]|uniref:hypothetical protein n=1 Tax=Ideonella sp. TaxID=1929293 RepID=UPI003BB6B7B8